MITTTTEQQQRHQQPYKHNSHDNASTSIIRGHFHSKPVVPFLRGGMAPVQRTLSSCIKSP
eukprot:6904869-Lingulodinium_polyedra.AAC.1